MNALLLVGAGCRQEPPARPEPDPPSLTAAIEADGYTVQLGEQRAADYGDCCSPGVSCLWNNPSTPYLVYGLPPGDVDTPELDADGWSRAFRLRADEVLILAGRTPPAAKYYSLRSYLQYRPDGDALVPILGSLGPSLNHAVVAERVGADAVWDAPFAVVTSFDAAAERRAVGWLTEAGWDPARVFVDRIPPALVRPGSDADADWFGVVARAAVFDDDAAGAAWLADPQGAVFRVTPTGPETAPAEPHPVADLPARGTGETEQAWLGAVDALQAAIEAAYPDWTPILAESTAWEFPTYDCIEAGACTGEIRDRYYAKTPRFWLPDDGTFLVAFGVNHERTGKASYANVSVNTIVNQLGLDTVESDVFPGSARAFLPDHADVDDLYAVVVGRDCAPFAGTGTPCLTVSTGCPGVDFDEPLMVDFRAYLEPTTGAAPLGAELVRDRALLLTPARSRAAP